MGKGNKKRERKPWAPGAAQDGPNKQNKLAKPAPPPESDSDDSFVLDNPVDGVYVPESSSDSENEAKNERPTMKVEVKQVYKNPAHGTHYYGQVDPDSETVSALAPASEVDYVITLTQFEKKPKKEDPYSGENWIESMYESKRNRNPPPHYSRAPNHGIHPSVLKPPPASLTNRQFLRPNEIKKEIKEEIKEEVKEEMELQSLAASLPQSIAEASNQDWELESIVSSKAWNNKKITFG